MQKPFLCFALKKVKKQKMMRFFRGLKIDKYKEGQDKDVLPFFFCKMIEYIE